VESTNTMRLLSQSFWYDAPWPIVSLAFFLRYPNPHAAHVVSCDVISRTPTDEGTLLTTRLILKRGALPKWAPQGIITRAESWVVEESEVDPYGKVVRCVSTNLDHTKILRVEETVTLQEVEPGKTLQTTQGRFISAFGWGLTKRIENHGLNKFKANIQKSREGVALVLRLLRESRMHPMPLTQGTDFRPSFTYTDPSTSNSSNTPSTHADDAATSRNENSKADSPARTNSGIKNWFRLG